MDGRERMVAIAVPVRVDSARMSKKMLRDDTGQALFLYTVERAILACRQIAGLTVVCGDQLVVWQKLRSCLEHRYRHDYVQGEINAGVPFTCGTNRIAHAIRDLQDNLPCLQYVINLQGDEPLVTTSDLVALYDGLRHSEYDIMTMVAPVDESDKEFFNSTTRVKAEVKAGECLNFSRARTRRTTHEHVGVYAFRISALKRISTQPRSKRSKRDSLEQLTWLDHGENIGAHEIKKAPLSINTEDDYKKFKEVLGCTERSSSMTTQ